MFTEYTCRHVAVGRLYDGCCSPHTPGFVALRRGRRGKPGYTVDGGGTELYGLVRMFTEYTCRHVAVGGLYAVCCSPHTPGFVALRRRQAGHASPVLYCLLLFYSVSHAIKKAVQSLAPLNLLLFSLSVVFIHLFNHIIHRFQFCTGQRSGFDIAAQIKYIGY